jgi:dTDP-glucose pyrophosphorylase
MYNTNIDKYVIGSRVNIRQAMKKLDESHRKILFVVKENFLFFGTLTDGDIRRWIIGGNSLDEPVEVVCNQNPITFQDDYNLDDIKNTMLEHRIQAIPIVDQNDSIINLLFWDAVFDSEIHYEIKGNLNIPVVIMAGGAGTRLDPFTKILPKPLIPIGERTVLEVVIDKFREYGINIYHLSLFHKAKMIKAYFDELNPPYKIKYLEEKKPLGTAGVLSQLKGSLNGSLFLTNCDTIINCDYKDLVDFHENNNYDITIVGSMINHRVPYGICEIENEGKLVSLTEKPEYSYLVSTGMYVLRGVALEYIPHNEHFNMTDLIDKIRKNDGAIGVYPISEKSWLDTGEWKEYKKTVEQLSL